MRDEGLAVSESQRNIPVNSRRMRATDKNIFERFFGFRRQGRKFTGIFLCALLREGKIISAVEEEAVNLAEIESEPIIVAAQIAVPVDTLKTEIQTLWAAREQNRLELAPRLYQLQIELSSPGKKDSGFKAWLKEAGIPRSTAYRLIKDHMKEMGLLPAKSEPATVSQVGQGAEIEPEPEPEPLPLIPGEVERRFKAFQKDLYGKSGALAKDLDGYVWAITRYVSPAEGKEEEAIRIWNCVIDLMAQEQRVLNSRRRSVLKTIRAAKEQLQRVQEGWRPLECLVKEWKAPEGQPAMEAVN